MNVSQIRPWKFVVFKSSRNAPFDLRMSHHMSHVVRSQSTPDTKIFPFHFHYILDFPFIIPNCISPIEKKKIGWVELGKKKKFQATKVYDHFSVGAK